MFLQCWNVLFLYGFSASYILLFGIQSVILETKTIAKYQSVLVSLSSMFAPVMP